MGELNGDTKIIMEKLEALSDKLDELKQDNKDSHTILFSKIDEIKKENARQDIDINNVGSKTNSVQVELTEHKQSEKWTIGVVLTIAGMFSSAIAWIITHLKK